MDLLYVNGDLTLDDFAFRAATPFIDVPAGVTLTIGVAPPTSGSAAEALAEFDVVLEAGETYVAFANGVLDPAQFAANPDGADIAFTLFPQSGIKEDGLLRRLRLIAFHGATDAPAVDIYRQTFWGKKALIGDLGYGEFSDYALLWPRHYTLDVTPAGDPHTVVASFEADLSGLAGGAAIVFASGFLSPADNQNGEAFGLFAALPDGSVIGLPAVGAGDVFAAKTMGSGTSTTLTGTSSLPQSFALLQNSPNPLQRNMTSSIAFALPRQSDVAIKLYGPGGRMVENLFEGTLKAGTHRIPVPARQLASGTYFYRMTAGDFVSTRQMTVVR